MKKSLVTLGAVSILSAAYATHTEAAEHTVQAGDTLWAIASQSNTTVDNLKKINNLDSNIIYPGNVIKTDGEEVVENVENADTYTVKSGDTLSIIGEKFGVSYQSIMEWNNLTSDLIFPGQVFTVVAPTEPVAETASVEESDVAAAVYEPVQVEEVEVQQEVQQPVQQVEQAQVQESVQQAQVQEPAQQVQEVQQPKQEVEVQNVSTQPASTPAYSNAKDVALSVAAGKSYVFGSNTAYAVDCSAFTQQFMSAYKGLSIPRSTYGQAAQGTPVSNPQPGDLVFFNNFSHVGVYVGNGMMVDALNASEGVGLRAVSYVHGHVDGYYRF